MVLGGEEMIRAFAYLKISKGVENMKKQTYYESIMEGLQQAVDFKNGDTSKCRVRTVTIPAIEPLSEYPKEKIREIRHKTNLSQKYFAELVGVSVRAVEAWETGTRKPTGSAKRLIQIIEKEPNIINAMVKPEKPQISI